MTVSKEFGDSVGKFIRNLGSHGWYATEASKQVASFAFWNSHTGNQVRAWVKSHLHVHQRDEYGRLIKGRHVADGWDADDGNEYLHVDGVTYLHGSDGNFYKV